MKNNVVDEREDLIKVGNLKPQSVIFFIADRKNAYKFAGQIRDELGRKLDLINKDEYKFCIVKDFPMYEWSDDRQRYEAASNPFSCPRDEDIAKLEDDKGNCFSRAYDLVLNGYELLSGSIRIHDQKLQEKVFEAIGMTLEEAKEKFGFFLEAFKYGTPPHGGVGIGLERLTMILADTENIRDVVAFPKTASAYDLMSEAPNVVDEKQLNELGIKIK